MNNLIFNNNQKCKPSPTEKNNKNFNFNKIKKNTLNSLNEVECFLNNFHRFTNYIKLYKILK